MCGAPTGVAFPDMSTPERKYLRVPVESAIVIRATAEGLTEAAEWPGTCSDISVAGMRFLCRAPFPVGAELEILMRAGDAVVAARARVVRVEGAGQGHHHGARFLLEDAGTVSELEDLVLV
jgi:hypothetical protein